MVPNLFLGCILPLLLDILRFEVVFMVLMAFTAVQYFEMPLVVFMV